MFASSWADWTGGPGGTAFVCEFATIVHKNFSGAELDWDRRYAPADSMGVTNPFGFESEENLRLNGVDPGSLSGAGVRFDTGGHAVRAAMFAFTLGEDPDGDPVAADATYSCRIDIATRSSPYSAPVLGSAQTSLKGDGSNTGTGVYKQPMGAVPPGLRTPSDIAGSVVYNPAAGTAGTSATVGVLGVGVDLAIVDGGYLLRVKQRVAVEEEVSIHDPWAWEVAGAVDDWSFEMEKEFEEACAVREDFSLEVNPPVIADEGVLVGEEFEAIRASKFAPSASLRAS